MGGFQQPFLYNQERFEDARFPATTFDPKAVTRASWEVKPIIRPKQNGPLVDFNRHPDAHEAPTPRKKYKVVGPRTKSWIRGMRVVQLGLRVVELVAALGVLALFILISKVDSSTAWIMRITSGVVLIHCSYAIFHLSRPAGGRTPGSSAAYMVFAAVSDLCAMPLYGYGVMAAVNGGDNWSTLLEDGHLREYFVPAAYYTLICGAGLHAVSLCISLWLGLKFHQITRMPPDMNPLEPHLTSRASRKPYKYADSHKRNKSSIATSSSGSTLDLSRLSSPLESHRRSGMPYEDLDKRPPSIPFSRTRAGSEASSLRSPDKRDSRVDLPSRMYQITPGNSPRNSVASVQLPRPSSGKRDSFQSAHTQPPPPPQSSRGSYAEVPLDESREQQAAAGAGGRAPKFTEAWYTSESLISRTQQRNRALNHLVGTAIVGSKHRSYAAVSQRRDLDHTNGDGVSDESDDDDDRSGLYDDARRGRPRSAVIPRGVSPMAPSLDETAAAADENRNGYGQPSPPPHWEDRPHPLRCNPPLASTPAATPPRAQTPFRRLSAALSEVSANSRSVSGSQDIADLKLHPGAAANTPPPTTRHAPFGRDLSKRATWGGGGILSSPAAAPAPTSSPRNANRVSSIQPENGLFYSKPYGELKAATPPVRGAEGGDSGNRQISSGHDYYDLGNGSSRFGRRNVSGKIAEEGRAGGGYSRYSVLNDD